MLQPDKEILQDVCTEIALENYGFLYVNDDKEEIRSRYESRERDEGLVQTVKDTLGGGRLGIEELQRTLEEIANDDFNDFERLRTGVYFYDPFKGRKGDEVTETLTQLFKLEIVVPERELKSRFNLAKEDVDFFTRRLEEENYIERITTSDHGDYFTIGTQLKGESDNAGVDARLRKKAKQGLIAHADLESVIDAAATSDVIRYLEHEEFIIALEEKYIVRSDIESFAAHVAREVDDHVADAFEESAYVLPVPEYERVVENEVKAEFEVLDHLNANDRAEVLEEVREALADELDLEENRDVVVQREEFDEYASTRAEEIREEVDDGPLGTPSAFHEAGYPRIEELRVSDSTVANEFVHEELKEAFDEVVETMFAIDEGSED